LRREQRDSPNNSSNPQFSSYIQVIVLLKRTNTSRVSLSHSNGNSGPGGTFEVRWRYFTGVKTFIVITVKMARWLVYAFVFLQVSFFVFGEDVETSTENTSSSTKEITPTTNVEPTRASKPSSTPPPLVHNPLNASETVFNVTKNTNTEQKNGATSLQSYMQVAMVSIVGVFLSVSAI
jgi:hypothetical protein